MSQNINQLLTVFVHREEGLERLPQVRVHRRVRLSGPLQKRLRVCQEGLLGLERLPEVFNYNVMFECHLENNIGDS